MESKRNIVMELNDTGYIDADDKPIYLGDILYNILLFFPIYPFIYFILLFLFVSPIPIAFHVAFRQLFLFRLHTLYR